MRHRRHGQVEEDNVITYVLMTSSYVTPILNRLVPKILAFLVQLYFTQTVLDGYKWTFTSSAYPSGLRDDADIHPR